MFQSDRKSDQGSPHNTVEIVGSKFWKSFLHLQGTASLLYVRQRLGYLQNMPLEKAVRRAIVSEVFKVDQTL